MEGELFAFQIPAVAVFVSKVPQLKPIQNEEGRNLVSPFLAAKVLREMGGTGQEPGLAYSPLEGKATHEHLVPANVALFGEEGVILIQDPTLVERSDVKPVRTALD